MDDCIFCKISQGEIPSSKIYEDEKFFAFLDIDPVAKGHTLLIPKTHVRWMADTEDSLVSETFITAKKLMNDIKRGLSCDFVQLCVVGEQVEHFHVHLIPSSLSEKLAEWKKTPYTSLEEIDEYQNKITN